MRTWILPALMLLALAACPSDTESDPTDAGVDASADAAVDAGVVDAGGTDAGVDAGVEDVPVDAGVEDVPVDAGVEDVPMDAGVEDVAVDAGAMDVPVDGGVEDVAVDAGAEDVPVDAGVEDVLVDAGAEDVPVDAGDEDVALPDPTPLTLTKVSTTSTGFKLPAGFGTEHTLTLFTSAAEFEAHFGVTAPSEVDFATEHALFFSAGSHPLSAGHSATVTEALDATTEVRVTTLWTHPSADCEAFSISVPVWALYRVSKPASAATTLAETPNEALLSCAAAEAGGDGSECSSKAVCGADLICVGLSFPGDWGLCGETSMMGTFTATTPVAIPDEGQVTLPLVVSGLGTVEVDVILYVEITHPSPSQLTLTMLNPAATQSVVVWDQVAGSGPDLTLHTIVLGFSGDETVNGEWALQVQDHVAGDTGTVDVLWAEVTSRWD